MGVDFVNSEDGARHRKDVKAYNDEEASKSQKSKDGKDVDKKVKDFHLFFFCFLILSQDVQINETGRHAALSESGTI